MADSFYVSRRGALISAAAAAGVAWFDLPAFAADDPFGGFPLGAQSYSLREFDTTECIRHLHGLGLHFVEMYNKHLDKGATDDRIAEVRKQLADAQIELRGHGVHGFAEDAAANRKIFEFAKKAGVKVITADPKPEAFDSLEKLTAEFDIRIAIHNHGPGHRYDKIAGIQKMLEGRHPSIGVCVDTGHFIRSGEDPVKALEAFGPRVFGAHIKDEKDFGKAASHNVVIGKGHLDVVGFFKMLKKIKFPAYGSLCLEYEANPKNPIDDMQACLVVAKEAIAKAAKES